jgi:hypothetical protein
MKRGHRHNHVKQRNTKKHGIYKKRGRLDGAQRTRGFISKNLADTGVVNSKRLAIKMGQIKTELSYKQRSNKTSKFVCEFVKESDELSAPAALPPVKQSSIIMKQEDMWALEPVWTLRKGEESFVTAGDRTPIPRSSSP